MSIPCVVARPLSEAKRVLEAAGILKATVAQTSPPQGAPAGPLRVVRQRSTSDGVELVVVGSVPLPERKDRDD